VLARGASLLRLALDPDPAPLPPPTEAEWEAAARGRDARRYAYGDTFDPARGNTFETHVRGTTPVGVFPGGETPEELADLTGNVWEWTGSLYQPYPYRADDGREDPEPAEGRRAVRGGSWATAGTTRARPSAAGTSRAVATTVSGFGWCARPPSLEPLFLAAA